MTKLFGSNAGYQAVEWSQLFLGAKIETLEHIVPQRGHLAVLSAEQFLQRRGCIGVGFLRGGELGLELVYSHEHADLLLVVRLSNKLASLKFHAVLYRGFLVSMRHSTQVQSYSSRRTVRDHTLHVDAKTSPVR